jgi:uncharacterized lipoprotein NlpE involved in copper resistance
MNKIFSIALLLAVAFVISGCNNQANIIQPTANIVEPSKLELTLDIVIEKLDNQGFKLGEKEETYYQMIGAYDGTKIDVNGVKIEIYEFLTAKEEAKELLMSADSTLIEKSNILILIHSKNADFVQSIKNSL